MASFTSKTLDYLADNLLTSGEVNDTLPGASFDALDIPFTETKINVPDIENPHFSKENLLGEGGMGFVHSAYDSILHRRVAVKSLLRTVTSNSSYWKRFYREAQITAQLAHPSIVPVYSINLDENRQPVLVMKEILGVTLDQFISECSKNIGTKDYISSKHGLLPRIEMMIKICDAINYAHTRGVIHRDIKPDNIMVGQFEDVYVMDWGLARPQKDADFPKDFITQINDDGLKTKAGALIGTPIYMAPEQAMSKADQVGYSSDQYSVGMLLYEMCSLIQARKSKRIKELIEEAKSGVLSNFHEDLKDLDPRLKAIIAKACQKDQTQRYPSMKMLALDLRRFTHNKSVWAHKESIFIRIGRYLFNRPTLSLSALILLIIITASSIIFSLFSTLQNTTIAQNRQELTTTILNKSLAQTRILDHLFVEPQLEVQKLASLTRFKLQNLMIDTETCLKLNQFTNTPDFKAHPKYLDPISLRRANCFLPEGQEASKAQIGLSLGMDIQSDVKELFSNYTPREQFEQLFWKNDNSKIHWIYFGYEDGTLFSYPAIPEETQDIDPRLQDWYKQGLQNHNATCGYPYSDASSTSFLIPCHQQILDIRNQAVGVIGIDFRLDDFLEKFNAIHLPKLTGSYLLDEERTILFSSQGNATAPLKIKERLFKNATFSNALTKELSNGLIETNDGIYSYSRMQFVPWTLILVFEKDILDCDSCFEK